MGRTVKDQKGQRTFPNVYEIVRRADGSFDIKYGICGQEYRDARVQLDESRKARLEFACGTIGTLMAEGKLKRRVKSRHGSKGD